MSAITIQTSSKRVASDVSFLLRARNPLLWIKSGEEARVEGFLVEAALSAGYEIRFWDVAAGVTHFDGKVESSTLQDIGDLLNTIQSRAENGVSGKQESRTVWVLRDPAVWLEGAPGASPLRRLRNLARFLPGVVRSKAQAIIVLSAAGELPRELSNQTTVIEWPLPDRAEIAAILDGAIASLKEEVRSDAAPNGVRDAAIDAAVGLTGEEAQNCYAKSLVQAKNKIDPAIVSSEKKRVIAREKVLEWYDPIAGGLDAVGGLDVLKAWLLKRRSAYSPAARAYGLPAPKGALLVGVPGCGKSLTAKAIATAWGVPLIKLDLNALKGKFVGESEANIRKAFRVIEALGRCVVWIDEIEKAMQGATSGAADGGVSADALGAVLTWMQERTSEAFVIATANDVSSLPPELLRKGRWDELFFVDLPNATERVEIVKAALKSHGRDATDIDLRGVADVCADFTGAEIAALVPEAMFTAFDDSARPVTTEDLIAVAKEVVPLAKTAEAKIKALRDWAKGNARRATSEVQTPDFARTGARRIEVA
jgi:MoxR-like ATPase